MVIIITGASHTGKTALAQKLLEKFNYPYLSIDHLKMGLIRSKNTTFTPLSDDELLTNYLWPIVCEIIKTAVENKQNLIVEGCYVPFNFESYFSPEYLQNIKYYCLIMSENYINQNISSINKYANCIETRIDDKIDIISLVNDNKRNLLLAKQNNVNYILIDNKYEIDIEI